MRIFVIFSILLAALLARAESQAQYFVKGFEFFVRGDYPSAAEMFRQIKKTDAGLYPQAAYYLGSIYAYEGNDAAYGLLEDSARLSKDPAERERALIRYARFCMANSNYKKFYDFLSKFNIKENSELDYYRALSLWYTDRRDEARAAFRDILKRYIEDKNAQGPDMIVQAVLENRPYANASYFSGIDAKGSAAKARIDVLAGKKINYSQNDISLYAQALMTGDFPKKIDADALEQTAYKFRDSPFAYAAQLALGGIMLEKKDYKKAGIYARDAIKLAGPDSLGAFEATVLLGDIARLQKEYDQARKYYQSVFMNRRARGEVLAESLYKCGLSWFEQGQWAEAHAYFQRVFVAFFRYEYWGIRAYYYDAQALYSLKQRRDANATLLEYFRRAKDKNSPIYKAAKKYYDQI